MRKRCVLLALMLVLIWPAAVSAATEMSGEPTTPAATPGATDNDTTGGIGFTIDNANIYDGMDKAYTDGYTPSVQNGMATIILPLLAGGEIKDGVITVTPGLGEPASSPFVFKNYQKTVDLQENAVNSGSAKVPSYLVRFDLALASSRVNGVYPVMIDIQASAADGSPVQQSFSCYVTVTDGKDPNAAEPTQAVVEPTVEKPTSQPKIIVSSYSVNPAPVTAGGEFTVTVTLKNTSDIKSVRNMMVTASCDSVNVSLLNESSVIYIKELGQGKTTDIELNYKTDLETPAQRYNITLAMEYDNSDAVTLTSSGTVAVEVKQPLRVELEAPTVETQVNAGDTLPLSFQVMNLGRGMIYNVRIELSAPGLIPSGTTFVGNIEAGTAMPGEMDVFIGTKDMSEGYEGEDKYGLTNGTITLLYEDGDGQTYTEKKEFSTTINAPVIQDTSAEPEEQPEKAGQWWISIVIGAVIAALLTVFLIVRGKRRQGKGQ